MKEDLENLLIEIESQQVRRRADPFAPAAPKVQTIPVKQPSGWQPNRHQRKNIPAHILELFIGKDPFEVDYRRFSTTDFSDIAAEYRRRGYDVPSKAEPVSYDDFFLASASALNDLREALFDFESKVRNEYRDHFTKVNSRGHPYERPWGNLQDAVRYDIRAGNLVGAIETSRAYFPNENLSEGKRLGKNILKETGNIILTPGPYTPQMVHSAANIVLKELDCELLSGAPCAQKVSHAEPIATRISGDDEKQISSLIAHWCTDPGHAAVSEVSYPLYAHVHANGRIFSNTGLTIGFHRYLPSDTRRARERLEAWFAFVTPEKEAELIANRAGPFADEPISFIERFKGSPEENKAAYNLRYFGTVAP